MRRFFYFFLYLFLAIRLVQAEESSRESTIVFDFGGVIAELHRAPVLRFFNETLGLNERKLEPVLRERESYRATGGTGKEFWKERVSRKTSDSFDDWFDRYQAALRKAIVEVPGTLAIVKELHRRGYRIAMLSNVTFERAVIIRDAGYYDLFDPVLLSYEIGVGKPDPRSFKILSKRLGVPGDSIVFIDDRRVNVKAAKKAGIDAIRFIDAKQLRRELEARGILQSDNAS